MPTYYACGCSSEYPSDDTWHSDDACPDCQYESDDESDGYADTSAASDAANYVNALAEYETPIMLSRNLRRAISCEWEASYGIATAQYALESLARGARFEHHGDVTCDGELVFSRLQLDEPESAHAYGRSLAVLDKLRREGAVRVSFATGHHIHVAARDENRRGISASNLVSLYAVFAHCEDLLYRLASAGWSQHRSESNGTYSGPMIKLSPSQRRTARHIGNAIGGEKYQGLNISNYIGNMSNCRCGAFRFGEWESCECSDSRATIEWRLWNGSISARKIRAYIAISTVLTDYAAKVDPRDCIELEENPFQGCATVDEESLASQLDYLVSRPGFVKRDREDIRWLVSFSPGMGSLATGYSNARRNIAVDAIAPSLA